VLEAPTVAAPSSCSSTPLRGSRSWTCGCPRWTASSWSSACATRRPGLRSSSSRARHDRDRVMRVIRLGAFYFLEKPFPLDALLGVRRARAGPTWRRPRRRRRRPRAGAGAGAGPALAGAHHRRSVLVNGQGLHSGARTGLILQPLPPRSGNRLREHPLGRLGARAGRSHRLDGYGDHARARGHWWPKTVEHLIGDPPRLRGSPTCW